MPRPKRKTIPDKDHKIFAQLLVDYRERNNYSQRDAALALGCSKRTLQNWEQARAMPQGFGFNAMLNLITAPEKVKRSRKRA